MEWVHTDSDTRSWALTYAVFEHALYSLSHDCIARKHTPTDPCRRRCRRRTCAPVTLFFMNASARARATFVFIRFGGNLHSFIHLLLFPTEGSALMKICNVNRRHTVAERRRPNDAHTVSVYSFVVIYCLLTFAFCVRLFSHFILYFRSTARKCFSQVFSLIYSQSLRSANRLPSAGESKWVLVYYYARVIWKVSFQFVTYSLNRSA